MTAKKLCLSVDWDFFIPSAREIWRNRSEEDIYNLVANWRNFKVGPDIKVENAENFWRWLRKWFTIPAEIFVSESHVAMDKLLMPHHKLILFDSHHDCYWNSNIDCGSWGTHWLENNPDARTIWISQFKKKFINEYIMWSMKKQVEKQVECVPFEKAPAVFNNMFVNRKKKLRFDFVHICRSGCWSPPQFDEEFVKFLGSSRCEIKLMNDFMKVNPLQNRMVDLPESRHEL